MAVLIEGRSWGLVNESNGCPHLLDNQAPASPSVVGQSSKSHGSMQQSCKPRPILLTVMPSRVANDWLHCYLICCPHAHFERQRSGLRGQGVPQRQGRVMCDHIRCAGKVSRLLLGLILSLRPACFATPSPAAELDANLPLQGRTIQGGSDEARRNGFAARIWQNLILSVLLLRPDLTYLLNPEKLGRCHSFTHCKWSLPYSPSGCVTSKRK